MRARLTFKLLALRYHIPDLPISYNIALPSSSAWKKRALQTLYAVDRSNNASAFSAMNSRLANRSIQSFGIALTP
jgi:hypothetical protein